MTELRGKTAVWLRCTSDQQAVLIDADRVLKIIEKRGDHDARGCLRYDSMAESPAIDETLDPRMMHLGFEDRG
jgi:hypothetical protein